MRGKNEYGILIFHIKGISTTLRRLEQETRTWAILHFKKKIFFSPQYFNVSNVDQCLPYPGENDSRLQRN